MPVPTKIKFKNYLKAVEKIVSASKNFDDYKYIKKSGSARRFEVYKNSEIIEMWVVHEEKYIHSKDLKKTCEHLKVTKKEFEDYT